MRRKKKFRKYLTVCQAATVPHLTLVKIEAQVAHPKKLEIRNVGEVELVECLLMGLEQPAGLLLGLAPNPQTQSHLWSRSSWGRVELFVDKYESMNE